MRAFLFIADDFLLPLDKIDCTRCEIQSKLCLSRSFLLPLYM